MKTLIIAENWPPRQGGIERYISRIAEHLPAEQLTVVAPVAKNSTVTDSTLRGRITAIMRKRFFWPFVRPSWLPLYISLHRHLSKHRVDVIIAGKALFEGLLALYLKKYLGIPYVVLTYAMEIETWAADKGTRPKLERVLEHASKVAYINEHTKKRLLEFGVAESNLVQIYPGVDDVFFSTSDTTNTVTSRYGITKPYIVSVARLVPRKGFDTLIRAYAKLDVDIMSQYNLVIVGRGPEAIALEELCRELNIETSVLFLQDVPDSDLPGIYAGATAFALTPKEIEGDIEGFGIVYMEAAAAGLAVIGTNTGGVPEAVLDGRTGMLVSPDSAPELTLALNKLLTDEQLRTTMGQAGKDRAWKEFRWNKQALLVKTMLDDSTDQRA